MAEVLATTVFIATFVLDVLILLLAVKYARKEGTSGLLNRSILFTGLSAVALGLHHILEIYHELVPDVVAEATEFLAAALLGIASYYLFQLVSAD